MTEVLDAPAKTSTALTVQARAAVALNTTKTEQHLKALATKNTGIKQILNKDGRTQAHGAAMELRAARVEITAIAKAARDDANKFSKAVIEEENRLIALIAPEETRLLGLRDAWDADQERIKRENEARERARIEALTTRIDQIRGYVQLAMESRTSAMVANLVEKLTAIAIDDSFEEYEAEAAIVKEEALKRVNDIHAAKLADEQERARAKAEQEAEALRLQQARDAQAAEAAKLEAEKAAFQAEQERARAELKAQADKLEQERLAIENEKRENEAAKAVEEYAAAITPQEQIAPIAPVECAQAAINSVAFATKKFTDRAQPTGRQLIGTIAFEYGVELTTAAEWLTNAADEIANFQE